MKLDNEYRKRTQKIGGRKERGGWKNIILCSTASDITSTASDVTSGTVEEGASEGRSH